MNSYDPKIEIRFNLVQQLLAIRGAAAGDITSIIRDVETLTDFIVDDYEDDDEFQLSLLS